MKRFAGAALAASSILLLTGCASGRLTTSTWGQYFEITKQSFANSFGDGGVPRDKAEAIPYASLGYRLNGAQQILVVLATDTRGEQLWTSSAHIVLVTQEGRVTRTVGLAHDIGRLAPSTGTALPNPALALARPLTVTLTADFPDISAYAVALTCRLAAQGPQPIAILGQTIATTRVDEDCENQQMGWRFRNSYWLDGDKFVWRALQHIHPNGDVLELEIFRPPG